jgi:SAM-dependent methyltransferase
VSDRADWRALNRAWWDARVPVHVASGFYDVAGFLAGRDPLRPFEVDEVGDVTGAALLHLQCHFGLDTLGWARRGASVTGLDLSEPAVVAARGLAADAGIDARFVVADVYDAAGAVAGRRYDVVYTGLGALNWLPDIERWAAVVADRLRPGGFLYLAEFHPVTQTMADDELTVAYPYFDPGGQRWEDEGTYADAASGLDASPTWEWVHPVGEVVSAVIAAGLRLEFLHEHEYTLFGRWPFLDADGDGIYRMPADRPSFPLMYSLRATRPPV